MHQIRLNGRYIFSSPNLNLLNQVKLRYYPTAQITLHRRLLETVSTVPPIGIIFTNLDQYIIDGIRQATSGVLIRSNVSTSRRLVVTQTSTFNFMTFVRIPPDNWTSTFSPLVNSSFGIRPTLSVVSGSGGTIDGGTSAKQFFKTEELILNPPTNRVNNLENFDIYKMGPVDESSTTLTPGEYLITLITGPFNANTTIATWLMSTLPIDTDQNIYFSTTQPFGVTNYFVMQLEN